MFQACPLAQSPTHCNGTLSLLKWNSSPCWEVITEDLNSAPLFVSRSLTDAARKRDFCMVLLWNEVPRKEIIISKAKSSLQWKSSLWVLWVVTVHPLDILVFYFCDTLIRAKGHTQYVWAVRVLAVHSIEWTLQGAACVWFLSQLGLRWLPPSFSILITNHSM